VSRVFSDHKGQRFLTIPGLAAVASSDRDGDGTLAFLETGGSIRCGGIDVVTHSTLQFAHTTEDAYMETGAGALNLNVAGTRTDSFQAGLGLRFEKPRTGKIAPQLTLRWAREYGELSRDVDASFVGTAQRLRVYGRTAALNRAQIQAGAVGQIRTGLDLEVAYVGELASGQETHSGFARAVWRW
jgi:uncharacterized protein with beta-barrel porin domain